MRTFLIILFCLEIVAHGNSFYYGAYDIHILHACLRSMIDPSTEINLNLADVIENWEILVVFHIPHLKVFLVDLKLFLAQAGDHQLGSSHLTNYCFGA